MKPNIHSEIGPLNKVFVFSPGDEHNDVLPINIQPYIKNNKKIVENQDFLLFDDIVNLKSAKTQHETFFDIINFYNRDSCYDLRADFLEIIDDLNIKIDYPIINLMYPRDISAIIGKLVLLTKSSSYVRSIENKITKHFFLNNKFFKDSEIIDFKDVGKGLSLEGGDIFVLSNDIIMIGISERTSLEAINLAIPYIFNHSFKYVVAVDLPKERAMMHLDTIFTQTSFNEGILFDNNDYKIKDLSVYVATKDSKDKNLKKQNFGFGDLFKEFGIKFNFISCGGSNKKFQLREQLTDGANSFVLEPGKIIMYNCNQKTINELAKNGYKNLTDKMFYNDNLTFDKILKNESKVVISINGSELVKGRGGPRCMTLPINRGQI